MKVLLSTILALTSTVNAQTNHRPFRLPFGTPSESSSSPWKIVDGPAPGSNENHFGFFRASNVAVPDGVASLSMKQEVHPFDRVVSLGSEVKSKEKYSFGIYGFTLRMASTAEHVSDQGDPVSGNVSGAFLYVNDSETEIDFEALGSEPGFVYLTSWRGEQARQQTKVSVPDAASVFHRYELVWKPESIEWYIDGQIVATHTKVVPSAPAYIEVNHWGSNRHWGGKATADRRTYLYVKDVTYTPPPEGK
jgi:hypothetical protein